MKREPYNIGITRKELLVCARRSSKSRKVIYYIVCFFFTNFEIYLRLIFHY